MTDADKIAYLEKYIEALIKLSEKPFANNDIIDSSRMKTVAIILNEMLVYNVGGAVKNA